MKTENMVTVLNLIRESTMNNILLFKNLSYFRWCLLFVFLCRRPKPGSQVLNPTSALQCCFSFCHTTKQTSSMYTYIFFFLSIPPYPQSHPSRSSRSTDLSSVCYTQLPTSYPFYTRQCICVSATLPIHPPLPFQFGDVGQFISHLQPQFSHLLNGNNLHQRGALRINQACVYSTWHRLNITQEFYLFPMHLSRLCYLVFSTQSYRQAQSFIISNTSIGFYPQHVFQPQLIYRRKQNRKWFKVY